MTDDVEQILKKYSHDLKANYNNNPEMTEISDSEIEQAYEVCEGCPVNNDNCPFGHEIECKKLFDECEKIQRESFEDAEYYFYEA